MDLATAGAEDFRPLEGELFAIDVAGHNGLTLAEVELRPQVETKGRQVFILLFAGNGDLLAQGTYRLEHASAGSIELFLVPVRQEGETVFYEAVFN